MIIEGSANLISNIERTTLKDQIIEALVLQNGRVIALSETSIALFKDFDSMLNPLASGLLGIEEIPAEHQLSIDESRWVKSHQAGFVELYNGYGILILPNDVRLYESREDALRNSNPLLSLVLS